MNNSFLVVLKNEYISPKVQKVLNQLQHDYSLKLTRNLIAVKSEHGPTNIHQIVAIELTESINFSFWGLLVDIAFSHRYVDEIIAIQSDEKFLTNNFYTPNKKELMQAIEEIKHELEHVDPGFSDYDDVQSPSYQSPLSYGIQYSSIF